MTSNGIIIVTVGVPGAGKTTLCRALVKELSRDASIFCRHVCYDDLINDRSCWGQPGFCWKMERKALYDDISSWLRCELINNGDGMQSCSKRNVWLIIDDNMYYRSMRYPYFQLARECRMAYAQIYIDCQLETAVQRNRDRPRVEQVPREVISRMNRRLQVPSPEVQPWEKGTIRLANYQQTTDFAVLENVLKQLWAASHVPTPPLSSVDMEEIERQRQLTKESAIHQADLILRRIVGEYHRSGDKKYSNEQLRVIKRNLLENIRNGLFDIPLVAQEETARDIFAECAAGLFPVSSSVS